jgi:hypothetical protein
MALELYNEPEDHLFSLVLSASVKIRFDVGDDGGVRSYTVMLPDGTELERPRIEEPVSTEGGE